MSRSVSIIGAGQIGAALAGAFGKPDDVVVLSRSPPAWIEPGARNRIYDKSVDTPLSADIVIDTVAFDAADIACHDPDRIGRLILISSASVYRDAEGRTLDEATETSFPQFLTPIEETFPTVDAGPQTYSARKIRMEESAIDRFGDRVTILRPCALHGSWSRHPREWWMVKRLLDGRTRIPLAYNGASRFQTTSAISLADLAWHLANEQLGGAFNVADWGCPDVLEILRSIAGEMGREVGYYPVAGFPERNVGRTPWSIPGTFELSDSKARSAGFRGADPYFIDCRHAVRWLVDNPPEDWRSAFPQLAAYPWDLFDYEAEDAYFASL